tara:strand:- start:2490 stop:2975 length:486 start_codon:yes stop_codon:yes gene_type:complete
MFFKYFNLKKNNLNNESSSLYQEIVNHSNSFIKNNLNHINLNFNEVFEIFSVVIIFYLKKLKDKNNAESKILSQTIIDNFVKDLDQHFREQGIGDMSIGKYVKRYVKKFYFRLKILDTIFETNNELDIDAYLKRVDILNNENIAKINANLLDLYNKILIEK